MPSASSIKDSFLLADRTERKMISPKFLGHLALAFLLGLQPVFAARYPSFGTVQTTNSSGVLNAVINNTASSTNLFDYRVQADLANIVETLQANDTDIRVVVFSSGNKEFFIAHIDVDYFSPGYESPLPLFDPGLPDMTFPTALLWNISQLPQATIAMVEGRARGIGNEFLMSCDMRFSTTSPSVLFAQLENSFGLNPGCGGAMYLSNLIGRGRTLEYVLSSTDIDAVTAEKYGWINRAFDTSAAMKEYVHTLARRIALFPLAGINGTKFGVNAVSRPSREVIVQKAQTVIDMLALLPATQAYAAEFIEATNNQSIGELELNYGQALLGLYNVTEEELNN
ncbi:ClpP/crotonase-like domain-containing protein [Roridomyces roridus]|uniref:ClpP/crotonase-like domain-containing protein n=1 Tax=Roridomyces roridus TaxID=1738132 RepID=A0AAD7BN21_9AGAR|nr:ClpP/crotonase-like domain-containing protein [Roridomyces roridus]